MDSDVMYGPAFTKHAGTLPRDVHVKYGTWLPACLT